MRANQRLLIIGDSMALGITELRGKDIVSTVRPTCVDYLRDFFGGWEIIINAEIHRKTRDILPLLGSLIESSKANYVLFALGGNDADLDWKRFIASRGNKPRTQVNVETMRENLLQLIQITRQHGAEPILSLFVSHYLPVRGEYLSRISGMDVAGWIARGGGDAVSERMLQNYWGMIEGLAGEQRVRLARYGQAVRAADPASVLSADGTHPSAAGHRLIAEAIISALSNSSESIDALAAG